MSKWVEVPVTIQKTYAVKIQDDETVKDAIGYVREEIFGGDVVINEGDCFVSKDENDIYNIKAMADECLC